MKTDIILAGVGGQGILSIAAVVGAAALSFRLYIKQAETHGMSQRGGDVQSFLRISDEPIFSDLIPLGTADLIVAMEPMEALRYLPYLNPEGYVVSSTNPFINIPDYPDITQVMDALKALPHSFILDADTIAREACGQVRCSNLIMLGAASPFIHLSAEALENGIRTIFSRKGEGIIDQNLKAFRAGRAKVKN